MALLQRQHGKSTAHISRSRTKLARLPVEDIPATLSPRNLPRPNKRFKKLLLLDMDETMLHAATLQDIYV
jgi:TFIIF-interacting CTD phosphatase-like protein